MAKGSAGKETSTTTSTQKRINTMATRKTLTKRQEKMIVDSYNDIDQVAIETSIGVIRLISLQEMPMMQMRQFMMTPGDKKWWCLWIFSNCASLTTRTGIKSLSCPLKK
jgi:hypothetical protein